MDAKEGPHGHLPYANTRNAAFFDDPNGWMQRHAGGRHPVVRGDGGAEFHGYELVRACFRDRRITPRTAGYYARMGVSPRIADFVRYGGLAFLPEEQHDRLRALQVKGFLPRRIEAARPYIRAVAGELLDAMLAKGGGDFVEEFSHHLSIRAVCRFIGIPESDVPRIDRATVELQVFGAVPFAPMMPRIEAALAVLGDYSAEFVERRRRERQSDFISDLITLQEEGGVISREELVWSITNLLLAGHDSTRLQLASLMRASIESGRWNDLAQRPDLLPAAINEAMRLYPVTVWQTRIVSEPMRIAGENFAAGEAITLNLGAAGRDPAAFANPDRFDPDRTEPPYDIGFGHGMHYCVGHALAKAEMVETMALLTARLRPPTLTRPPRLRQIGMLCGPEELAVGFAPR